MVNKRGIQTDTLHSGRRGVAMMEFTIVFPVLMLVLMGAADFSRMFFSAIEVASAARAGAQYATQDFVRAGDITGITAAARNDASDISGLTVDASRSCVCRDGTSISCTGTTCGSGSPKESVTVRTQYTFRTLFSYPGIPSQVTLSGLATMRAQ